MPALFVNQLQFQQTNNAKQLNNQWTFIYKFSTSSGWRFSYTATSPSRTVSGHCSGRHRKLQPAERNL